MGCRGSASVAQVFQGFVVVHLEIIPFVVDVSRRMVFLDGLLVADALVVEAILQACSECPVVIRADDLITRRGLVGAHMAAHVDVGSPSASWSEGFKVGGEVGDEFRPRFHIEIVVPLPWRFGFLRRRRRARKEEQA